MTDRLQQLEQKLQVHQKRIADLEVKYAQLLEDLRTLRAQLTEKNSSRGTGKVIETSGYQPAFDRWPAQNPDDERIRNAGYAPTPTSDIR